MARFAVRHLLFAAVQEHPKRAIEGQDVTENEKRQRIQTGIGDGDHHDADREENGTQNRMIFHDSAHFAYVLCPRDMESIFALSTVPRRMR